MCTVSVIPLPATGHGGAPGFRMVSSRDESRKRGPALPPEPSLRNDAIPAIWPVDSDGGGTWISANAAGVVLTILNVYRPEIVSPEGRLWVSRGLIIPTLASSPSAADAAARIPRLDLARFHPFRLIAIDRESLIECRWDGGVVDVVEGPIAPACFSSHGWGDRNARHRLLLFRRWFSERAYTPDEQDAFHRHRWPSRPEISVRMSREESRTVSITTISVAPDDGEDFGEVRMEYEPLDFSAGGGAGISVTTLEAVGVPAAGGIA